MLDRASLRPDSGLHSSNRGVSVVRYGETCLLGVMNPLRVPFRRLDLRRSGALRRVDEAVQRAMRRAQASVVLFADAYGPLL